MERRKFLKTLLKSAMIAPAIPSMMAAIPMTAPIVAPAATMYGKGLYEQLQNGNRHTYKMYTGEAGMKMFEDAIKQMKY